jgi:hypothetical protein
MEQQAVRYGTRLSPCPYSLEFLYASILGHALPAACILRNAMRHLYAWKLLEVSPMLRARSAMLRDRSSAYWRLKKEAVSSLLAEHLMLCGSMLRAPEFWHRLLSI